MRSKILLVDNDEKDLIKWGELLESEGYSVFLANNSQKAREDWEIDLAVIDIRLIDDNLEQDYSGLQLAAEQQFRHIPKIILTSVTITYEQQRTLWNAIGAEPLTIVTFVGKAEDTINFINEVHKILDPYEKVTLSSKSPEFFNEVVKKLLGTDHLHNEEILKKSKEIEQILRRLLYRNDKVVLELVPTNQPQQTFIRVELWKGDFTFLLHLIKCGLCDVIKKEIDAYQSNGQYLEGWAIQQENVVNSTNFGAVEYSITGFNFEKALWLADVYKWRTAEEIVTALDDLFKKASSHLYSKPYPPNPGTLLNFIIQESLGFSNRSSLEQKFEQGSLEAIEYMQNCYINMKKNTTATGFELTLPNGEWLSCPDPIVFIYQNYQYYGSPTLLHLSLGKIDGYSVLVDQDSKCWMTEFNTINPAAILNDPISIEALIRFEWTSDGEPDWDELYTFESLLVDLDPLKEWKIEKTFKSEDLNKALNVIFHIRKLTAKYYSDNAKEYQIGLLFKAIGLIASDTSQGVKARALLAAAIICQRLEQMEKMV